MRLAIFDFDGTITDRDSFQDFIHFSCGPVRTLIGGLLLSPIILLYLLKIMPNWRAKEIVFTYFFKGMDESAFLKLADTYARQRLPRIIKKSAWEKLQWYKREGDAVIIISASFDAYLAEWCKAHQLALLATTAEFKGKKLTGKILGKNCYGPEKVRRLKEIYRLEDFEHITAYGDSKGDFALRDIAHEFHYRNFR